MPEYEMSKHPEYFRVYQPSGIHTYKLQYFNWVVEWFKEIL